MISPHLALTSDNEVKALLRFSIELGAETAVLLSEKRWRRLGYSSRDDAFAKKYSFEGAVLRLGFEKHSVDVRIIPNNLQRTEHEIQGVIAKYSTKHRGHLRISDKLTEFGPSFEEVLYQRFDDSALIKILTSRDSTTRFPNSTIHYLEDIQHVEIVSSAGNWVTDTRLRGFIYIDFAYYVNQEDRAFARTGFVQTSTAEELTRVMGDLLDEGEAAALRRSRRLKRVKPGYHTVIISANAGEFMHEVVGHSLETMSPGSDPKLFSIGEQLGPRSLSVYDDPTFPMGFASRYVDDLGFLTKKRALIEYGCVMPGFLRPEGTYTRANYRSVVKPRMSNLVVEPSSQSAMNLLPTVENGILIDSLKQAYFNPRTGRFFIETAEARRIVNGVLCDELENLIITGLARDAIQRLVDVGSDVCGSAATMCSTEAGVIPSSVSQPMLLFDGLNVTHCGASSRPRAHFSIT